MFQQKQFTTTLSQMIGQCKLTKPNCSNEQAKKVINERIRTIVNRKDNWSGLYKQGVVFLPNPYSTGSITFNYASPNVTGIATVWPVADVVDTAIANGITQQGMNWVTPGDMSNITVDTMLLVDRAGTPEVVTPLEITPTSFFARFIYPHNFNCTVECSSLAGQQLRTDITQPIYNVLSVNSPTSLTIDISYLGTLQAAVSYQITKMYITIDPSVKYILGMQDKIDGYPLKIHVPRAQLDYWDPQRSATGQPTCLADMGPLPNGNMGYEIYPPTNVARQLIWEAYTQPPTMQNDADMPPMFINPTVILYGAYADLLRMRVLTDGNVDPYYDPAVANRYDDMFEKELSAAMTADGDKAQTQFTYDKGGEGIGGGFTWFQSHDYSN